MAKPTMRGATAATSQPASDLPIDIRRVQADLRRWVQDILNWSKSRDPRLAAIARMIMDDIERLFSSIDVVRGAFQHLNEAQALITRYDQRTAAVASRSGRPPPSASISNRPRTERWRKRPMTDAERDAVCLDLLRVRAAGPEALARAKQAVAKRRGLSLRGVAALLNTCVGRRFALGFAGRVVARATEPKRQAQLVVELSSLLGVKQSAIVRAVRALAPT